MTTATDIPQYRQIADTLRRRIRDGVYRAGETLPPATELEARFAVSNITIRKALGLLADQGWVTGRRGIGTLVTAAPPPERVILAVSSNFREWFEAASGTRLAFEQVVLEFGPAVPAPRAARALGRDPDEPLWRMRRLRRIRGEPVSYHVNYGRPETLGQIDADRMAGNRNFIDVIRHDLGLAVARIEQTIEAIVADRDLAEVLAVPFGAPLFFVENIYLETGGPALAVSHLFLRSDRYAYQADISLTDETAGADETECAG